MADRPTKFDPSEAGENERGFGLGEALGFAWRQWKFIGAVTAVVCLIGTTLLLQRIPLYTATSLVLLEQPRQKTPGGEAVVREAELDDAMLQGQMMIIGSTVLLRRVVQREQLTSDVFAASSPRGRSIGFPAFASSFVSSALSLVQNSRAGEVSPRPESVEAGVDPIPADEMGIIQALKSSLTVSRITRYGFGITISVTLPDPVRAARLANAVADAYLVDKLETRFETAKRASTWLRDRLVGLREQLHDSEEAVAEFRGEHGLVQTGNVTLNQQQLSDLNAQLISARADLAQKKTQVELLNAIQAKNGSLQNMPGVTSAGALPSLRGQETALSTQKADLLARYGPSHPLVVNIEAQLREVGRSIGAEAQRLASSLRKEYELTEARIASLEISLRQATGQTSLDEGNTVHLRELERTAAVNKTLFEEFLKQAKIAQVQSTFEPQDTRVITPALPPGAPSYPNKTRYMAFNLMIGLLFGVGGALAKERLNATFTTPKQVEALLGLPLLASVSELPPRGANAEDGSVPLYDYPIAKPLSRYSDSINSLRRGIRMTDVDHPPKVVQVTSAVPLEGKTTITLSLAASAASSKLKVLLIDADLRHPGATHALGPPEAGLVDLLMGDATLEEVVKMRENAGYWVLGAGNKTQNPTDLLASERMKLMLAEFKETYDLVVIDTSPAGPVIDSAVVSEIVDKVVLVVRWGSTARALVRQCVGRLSGHGKIAGVAFNRVNEKRAKKYGEDAHSYYYGNRYYKDYYTR